MVPRIYAMKYIFHSFFCFLICLSPHYIYSESSINDAFFEAVENGDIYLVNKLLKSGADINYVSIDGDYTALSIASASGNAELVEYLIKFGAHPTGSEINPNQPIYFAIAENYPEIVDILIRAGVSPNYRWTKTDGSSLLTNAIQFGHLKIVNILIDHGADVNLPGSKSLSPIYRAIIADYYDIILLLLRHGAKLNEKDKSALKALKWFEDPNNYEIICLLKKMNALDK